MKRILATLFATLVAACAIAQTPPTQIRNLPTASTPLTGTEYIPSDQGVCFTCTVKITTSQLATYVLAQPFTVSANNIIGTLPCGIIPALTGVITTTGCVSFFSNISAISLLGNSSVSAGRPGPITLGTGLYFSGSTLNANTAITVTSGDGSIVVTGSPGTILGMEVNASDITQGVLPVLQGGSGTTTATGTGSLVLASGAVITLANATGLPLTTGVTGILGITNGGTASASANGALNNLLPSQTGSAGNCLGTNGSNASWVTCGSGGGGGGSVTSVGLTLPSYLTVSGSPITTAGSFTVTGTSETSHFALMAPNGSAGAMTPRAIVAADLPAIPLATGVSGTLQATNAPAYTGDMTASAGTLATSVVKVNGGAVPASASVLGSNSSSQLVTTSTTGSGAVVLATNASLTTPNLGIPSALDLLHATDLQSSAIPATIAANTTGNAATATTTSKVNGGVIPIGATAVGTNGSGQFVSYTPSISLTSPLSTITVSGSPGSTLTEDVNGANLTGIPLATGVSGILAAVNAPAYTGDMTSSSGTLITTVNTVEGGTPLANSATIDATNPANIFFGSTPLSTSGTNVNPLLTQSFPTYAATTALPIVSGNIGGVIYNICSGTSTATFPDINTSGIVPGSFNVGIVNECTGAMTLTATTSTLMNGVAPGGGGLPQIPAGGSAIIYADANNSTYGQYNYVVAIGGAAGGVGLGANTWTGIQTYSYGQPSLRLADTGQSGTNITDWDIGLTSGTNGTLAIRTWTDSFGASTNAILITRAASGTNGVHVANITFGTPNISNTADSYDFLGTSNANFSGPIKTPLIYLNGSGVGTTSGQSYLNQPASNAIGFNGVPGGVATEYGYFDGLGNLHNYFMDVSEISAGATFPLVSLSGGNCSAASDTSGTTLSATATTGSSSFAATNTFAAGDYVTFAGTNIAPYVAGTQYYVIPAGLSGSTFEVAASQGGSSVGNVTGSGGSLTVTNMSGNYHHIGGLDTGGFTLPASGTYNAGICTITLTFPTGAKNGYRVLGASDETANAQLTQSNHSQTTAVVAKATAPAASDYISFAVKLY